MSLSGRIHSILSGFFLTFSSVRSKLKQVGDNNRSFCLPPEGQEVVNLLILVLVLLGVGIISFFFH